MDVWNQIETLLAGREERAIRIDDAVRNLVEAIRADRDAAADLARSMRRFGHARSDGGAIPDVAPIVESGRARGGVVRKAALPGTDSVAMFIAKSNRAIRILLDRVRA